MKVKLLFSLLIAFTAMGCQKKFTCTCTENSNGAVTNQSEYKLTKSDAESACSNATNSDTVSCELKKGWK